MSDFPVTVFHNPNCGTSRSVLDLVRDAGHEPEVVEYLNAGWTADRLKALLADMGRGPRDVLRAKEPLAAELGLLDAGVSDEALIAAMVEHPVLVERPIVRSPKGVRLGRPRETVLDIL